MGKRLDALFCRRHLKASKFKALVNLAISRLAILKNQRGARHSLARSDVVQLLQLGHHDRALLRVEQFIKEQNTLDVYLMIEGYCHLLLERINLMKQERVCPEELKEAVSSLVYAATRCGDFPELQEMRTIFTARFGKEFAARAIELRNNCGVDPKMIRKLSTRQPSLESRLKVLKEIASENNVVLHIEEASSWDAEGKLKIEQNQNQSEPSAISGGDNLHNFPDEIEKMEGLPDSMRARRKYKDVADAAEEAFKSAAYAAAAARAAVELSRSESHDPDDQNSPGPKERKVNDKTDEDQNGDKILGEEKAEELKEREHTGGLDFDMKPSLLGNEGLGLGKFNTVHDEDITEKDSEMLTRSQKKFPLRSQEIEKADYSLNVEKRPISVRTRRGQVR